MKKDKKKKLSQTSNEASYVVKHLINWEKAEKVSISETGWIQTENLSSFNNYLEEY